MKIIRPEQSQKQEVKKEENIIKKEDILIINGHEFTPFEDKWGEPQTVEDIMNDVLNNGTKNITFTITLTKRQYELWIKKGGEKWLKKALVGQANIKRKSTRKA